MPTQRIHRRVVDDDKSDLTIGLKADSFSQLRHALSQAVRSVAHGIEFH